MTLIDDAPTSTEPVPALDVGALRHPTESSRFALALLACTAVVSITVYALIATGAVLEILAVLGAIVGLLFVIWLSIQLWRIRLLADGVKVDEATLPEVQAVVDFVRGRLNYDCRLEMFVVDKMSRVMATDAPPITLTSYFGVRVIVIEGAVLGDLSKPRERQQLVFILATYVGALKARHTRWSPVIAVLQISGLTKLLFPFVFPWYRATVYTGDRIAYSCCGDLGVSLEAVYRALVGKEVAPHLRDVGLVAQALTVRRKIILRLAQLLRPSPHATSRYLELLSFVAADEPDAYGGFRTALGPGPSDVDNVITALQRRRRYAAAAPIAVVLAALMLAGSAVAGMEAQGDEPDVVAGFNPADTAPPTAGTTEFPTSTSPQTTTSPTPTTAASETPSTLNEMFPKVDFTKCTGLSDGPGRATAIRIERCTFSPGITAEFQNYGSTELERDVATWSRSATNSATWSQGASHGRVMYVPVAGGRTGIYWTYDPYGFSVLAYASSSGRLSFADVQSWWQTFYP